MNDDIPQDIRELAERTTIANPWSHIGIVRTIDYEYIVVKSITEEGLQQFYNKCPGSRMWSHPPMV